MSRRRLLVKKFPSRRTPRGKINETGPHSLRACFPGNGKTVVEIERERATGKLKQ